MILAASILLLAVTAVNSQIPGRDYRPRSHDDNVFGTGQISRQETADGNDRVQGFYSSANAKGYNRIVDYVVNQNGSRPHVRANEPGTGNQNPADVIMESASVLRKRNYHYKQRVTRRPVASSRRPQVQPRRPQKAKNARPVSRTPVRSPPPQSSS